MVVNTNGVLCHDYFQQILEHRLPGARGGALANAPGDFTIVSSQFMNS